MLRACYQVFNEFLLQALPEGPEPDLLNNMLKCYREELAIAVIESKRDRSDSLKDGPFTITSYLYGMSKTENSFQDESGAK